MSDNALIESLADVIEAETRAAAECVEREGRIPGGMTGDEMAAQVAGEVLARLERRAVDLQPEGDG